MWALRIMGGLFFVLVAICSRLVSTAPGGYAPAGWTPKVAGRRRSVQVAGDKDWKRMLKTPVFWVLVILFTIGTTSGLMVIGHASPIAQDVLGMTPAAAGRVVSFLAIGMVLGKIGWGALSDRIGRFPVFVMMLIVAAAALLVHVAGRQLRAARARHLRGGTLLRRVPRSDGPDHRRGLRQQEPRHQLRHHVPDRGPRGLRRSAPGGGGLRGQRRRLRLGLHHRRDHQRGRTGAGQRLHGAGAAQAPAKPKARPRLGGHVEEPKTSEA